MDGELHHVVFVDPVIIFPLRLQDELLDAVLERFEAGDDLPVGCRNPRMLLLAVVPFCACGSSDLCSGTLNGIIVMHAIAHLPNQLPSQPNN